MQPPAIPQNMTTKPMGLYRQPTLPHLLQEYGLQNATRSSQRGKKNEQKEKRKKDHKKSGSFLPDDDRDLDKEREMDEHYLKMVRDIYHLRDYYYNEYSSLLAEKVEKQRREMRERDAKFKNALILKEEEERKASHRVKKRLERHTLETTPMTAEVPKTDLYYIMGLEDKLRREGKLKTQSDFDKFRVDMNVPHIFYANFKVNKNSDFTKYSNGSTADLASTYSKGESNDTIFEMTPDLLKPSQEQESHHQRSLSRISESRESPVPVTRPEKWAVTQQFPSQYRSRKSISHSYPSKSKSEKLSDLEKRFPKLEMPKLHCFTLNLNKKPPDPEEVRQQTELRAKEKGRKKAMRTYTKMYQLAMTNAATTSRIMDNFDDMNMLLKGPDLCDVIADHHWMQAYGLTDSDMERQASQSEIPAMTGDENVLNELSLSQERTPALEGLSPKALSRGGSTFSERTGSRRSQQSSAKSKSESPQEEATKIIPLTLDEIRDDCDLKESKTLSSLWSNYLRAGQSSWMRTEQ